MSRIEEIDTLLKLLDLTHRIVVTGEAKPSEAVAVVDFLRQSAFNLNQEKQTLLANSSASSAVVVVEPETVGKS